MIPSKTELAFVSPGCTRDVIKITYFFDCGIRDFLFVVALIDIEGTGKPDIVLHRSLRS